MLLETEPRIRRQGVALDLYLKPDCQSQQMPHLSLGEKVGPSVRCCLRRCVLQLQPPKDWHLHGLLCDRAGQVLWDFGCLALPLCSLLGSTSHHSKMRDAWHLGYCKPLSWTTHVLPQRESFSSASYRRGKLKSLRFPNIVFTCKL